MQLRRYLSALRRGHRVVSHPASPRPAPPRALPSRGLGSPLGASHPTPREAAPRTPGISREEVGQFLALSQPKARGGGEKQRFGKAFCLPHSCLSGGRKVSSRLLLFLASNPRPPFSPG